MLCGFFPAFLKEAVHMAATIPDGKRCAGVTSKVGQFDSDQPYQIVILAVARREILRPVLEYVAACITRMATFKE